MHVVIARDCEHPELASSQPLQSTRSLRANGRKRDGECVQEPAGHGRSEQSIAPGDDPDGQDQLIRPDVLQKKTAGPRTQRLDHVLVDIERREDQNPGRLVLGCQDPGGLDPIQDGHPDVHEDHVRSKASGLLDRLRSIRGLADEIYVLLRPECHVEGSSHERLVIRDQDPDRHDVLPSSGRDAATW